jgi:Sec-independent protein translocase protein TatA
MRESRLEPVDWLLVAMVAAILFFTISKSLKR